MEKQQVKEASSSISPSTAGVPTEGTQKVGSGDRQPTSVFLPEKSHGQRAWQATVHGVAESDMTEAKLSIAQAQKIL